MDLAGRPEVFRVLVVVGALVVAAMVVLARRLARRVALEEADRALSEEYEALGRSSSAPPSGH
jgi:hypothetical protein